MLHDAHLHLQDERLDTFRTQLFDTVSQSNGKFGWFVVNGTQESDWARVHKLYIENSNLIQPAYGLHPWHVGKQSTEYLTKLETLIRDDIRASIGEIGLDAWFEGHDLDTQEDVFRAQLDIAHRYNRAASIHCLKCWGRLLEILKSSPLPERGLLIHAYSGSTETMRELVKLGAYFSFNLYYAQDRKKKVQQTFKEIPVERLLVETDAPDMLPPDKWNRYANKDHINSPLNIQNAYEYLSQLRTHTKDTLVEIIHTNFQRLFL